MLKLVPNLIVAGDLFLWGWQIPHILLGAF